MKKEKIVLFDAVEKCLTNADQIFEEAQILKKYSKIYRAYTLFQFCIEEIGKVGLIYKYLFHHDVTDKSVMEKFHKEFRDHKKKISASIFFDKILDVVIMEEDEDFKQRWIDSYTSHLNNIHVFNDLKNLSLYTSFYNNKYCLPSEFIDEEMLENIEFFAKSRLTMAKNFHTVALTKPDDF